MNVRLSPKGPAVHEEWIHRVFGRWQPPLWLDNLHPQRLMERHSQLITNLRNELQSARTDAAGLLKELRELHAVVHGTPGRYHHVLTVNKLRELLDSTKSARATVFRIHVAADNESPSTEYPARDAATALAIAFEAGPRTVRITRDDATLIVERGGLPR